MKVYETPYGFEYDPEPGDEEREIRDSLRDIECLAEEMTDKQVKQEIDELCFYYGTQFVANIVEDFDYVKARLEHIK